MLNERFSHVDKPFHSSGYAEVAQGTSMGSTNAQSFGERYRVNMNRQHIQRYSDSHLANAPFRRTVDSNEQDQNSSVTDRRRSVTQPKPIVIPPRTQQRPRFSEPTGRNYNPFG